MPEAAIFGEVTVNAPATQCFELVLAIRRYPQWWRGPALTPLGPEGRLRIGSRLRCSAAGAVWTAAVTAVMPWQRVVLEQDGDFIGRSTWEFIAAETQTRVRYGYESIEPNTQAARELFASGQVDTWVEETLAAARTLLESPLDLSGADLFETLFTTPSVRRFREDPIPDALLVQIIAAATHAPSAWNAQPWRFLALREPERRRTLAELYLKAWRQAQAFARDAGSDAHVSELPHYTRMMRQVDALARQLDSAPVLVLAGLDTTQLGPMADGAGHILAPQSAYASIFPAVQNLMLAARGFGIGSTLTTVFALCEDEIRTALGIPPHIHLAALIPLGYPERPFAVTRRNPVEQVAFGDEWGRPLRR